MKLASCKSDLNSHPMVYSNDRSKAVVPVLVLLFVALWFILRGDSFYVLPCVILFLCFFSPFSVAVCNYEGCSKWIAYFYLETSNFKLAQKYSFHALEVLPVARNENLSAFRTFFDLRLFGFVCFLFHSVSGKDCGLWLWHSLDFSLTFFCSFGENRFKSLIYISRDME